MRARHYNAILSFARVPLIERHLVCIDLNSVRATGTRN